MISYLVGKIEQSSLEVFIFFFTKLQNEVRSYNSAIVIFTTILNYKIYYATTSSQHMLNILNDDYKIYLI